MDRRRLLLGASASLMATAAPLVTAAAPRRKPNFIIILCDDLGYGDLSLDGTGPIATPNLAQMAREGVTLTDYYAPANLCTPSRAGLLTGRYPVRTGLGFEVIMQPETRGLPLSEVTLPKALKADYVSGLFGKWHLGHAPEFWPPTKHGFDTFFGIPYSHDMKPLALYEAHAGVEDIRTSPADLPTLQQQFYTQAEAFIERNKDRPFLVELALSSPHLPSHPVSGSDVRGPAGPYGATVVEIDGLVGRLMAKLKSLGIDQDTLVLFTSDNGPWFEGSSGGLRDRKGGAGYDGGYRVPFLARQPGTLPAGKRVNAITMGIDLLPTLCAMAGVAVPAGVEIDGKDISAVLKTGAPSPHDALLLFDNEGIAAIRTQRWKYVAQAYYRGNRFPIETFGLGELFDVGADKTESYNLAANYPEVVSEMKQRLTTARATFAPYRHKDIPAYFKQMRDMLDHMQD